MSKQWSDINDANRTKSVYVTFGTMLEAKLAWIHYITT